MRNFRLLAALSIVAILTLTLRPTPAHAGSYMFIAYGDTRSQPDIHRAVIARIVAAKPEFVVQTGDLVSNGRNADQWTEFDSITEPLRKAGIGYYPSRGNHDLGTLYIKHAPKDYDSGNGYYYAVTRHNSVFIAVDSMDPVGTGVGTPQYTWLENELTKAQGKAAHVFVFFHESPFSVGPHGPDATAQRDLHPLFVKHHVSCVFCGHDHLYYRTVRDGLHYFVTGGGGAPLYQPDNANLAIQGDVYSSVYHYIKLVVDGKTISAVAYQVDPAGGPDKIVDKLTWSD